MPPPGKSICNGVAQWARCILLDDREQTCYSPLRTFFGEGSVALDLTRLTNDLDTMGETLVKLDRAQRSQLQIAQERLATYAHALEEINEKVQLTRERNLHWRGAYPAGDEPLDARYPRPQMPARVNIIANDGSQVPIDRHAAALYYALNVGYIVYPYGTVRCPDVGSAPSLHFGEDELRDRDGRLVSNAVVNARRTVREMQNLADLAAAHTQFEPPVAVLTDGPLMWVQPGDTPQERRSNLEPYLEGLERIRTSGAALGGYVDRPGSTGVVRLLHLASLSLDKLDRERLAHGDLVGLSDAPLFATLLGPGERSALFVLQSPTNKFYGEKGHEIWHFYLNVSQDPARPLIARLEVPSWVGQDPLCRDLLHAVVWQQCQIVGGYPYVLARAHELALISTDERRDLQEMVVGALRRRGLDPRPSEKARQKELTGGFRRRHSL
jgi:hypothetical protein